jgi:hypothetical protein
VVEILDEQKKFLADRGLTAKEYEGHIRITGTLKVFDSKSDVAVGILIDCDDLSLISDAGALVCNSGKQYTAGRKVVAVLG